MIAGRPVMPIREIARDYSVTDATRAAFPEDFGRKIRTAVGQSFSAALIHRHEEEISRLMTRNLDDLKLRLLIKVLPRSSRPDSLP